MKIRRAKTEDVGDWLRMHYALWPEGSLAEHEADIREQHLDEAREVTFVCEREGGGLQGFVEVGIRAYAEGCSTDRVGYIEGWYVDEDVRLQGVGRRLIEAAEAWAISQGCTEMGSDVLLDNPISQQAHQRLGYKEVERIVCYLKPLSRAGKPF
jgi:aminoglycoside 6'-N-acetyltransferase I